MKKITSTLLFSLFIFNVFLAQVQKTNTPNWVNKVEYNKNPKIDEASIEQGLFRLLYEQQINETTKEFHFRYATKITENVGVQAGSSIDILYDPSFESLEFHSIYIIRNGEYIDKLKTSDFQLIRRELNSENYIYDGTLSAMSNLSDVRVDDIIEYSYSIKGDNPIHKGKFFYTFYLNDFQPVGQIHLSVLTNKNLDFSYKNSSKEFNKSKKGDSFYYLFSDKSINTNDYDLNAPGWKLQYKMAFVSEYKTWKDVINWGVNVFDVNKSLSKELKNKILEINNANTSSGDKINASLNFVQDDIRYLGLESGIGAYEPFSSSKVFEQRFGDCKDKSLLLVTMLNEMGIEAYPMLVNTYLKKTITELPPSPTVFDHCVVKVIDKKVGVLFYDPTIANQGGSFDTNAFPDYRFGLVLKKGNTELDEIYSLTNSNAEVTDYYELEEVGKGATLKTTSVYFDAEADYMRSYYKNNSINSIKKEYESFYANYFYNIKSKKIPQFKDDIENNKFTTYETYEIDSIWQTSLVTNQIIASFYPYTIINTLSMPEKRDRDLPFALPYPTTRTHKINVKLPQKWNIDRENININSSSIFYDFDARYNESKDLLSLTHILKFKKDHVTFEEFNSYYDDVKKIDTNIAYSLIIPVNAKSSFSSENWLEYFGIFLFILVFLSAVWSAIKVYEYDPEPKIESYFEENKKINGWLILLGISLCLSPIGVLITLFSSDATLLNGSWILFLDPNSEFYNLSLGIVILFEMVVNVFLFVYLFLYIYLFFTKRSSFPKLYAYTLIGILIFIILDTFLVNLISNVNTEQSEINEIIKSFLRAAIISSYLLLSDNVKETFIKRLDKKN